MTPRVFFRLMSVFAAVVATITAALACLQLLNSDWIPFALLAFVAAVNIAAYRTFRSWTTRG